MVARANGVGPKLAMRIVNELAGKLGSPALAGAAGCPRPARRPRRRRPLRPRQPRLQARRSQRGGRGGQRGARRRREPRCAGPAGAEEGGEVTTHTASCRCGQLKATVTGEPVRVSVCHCLDCKKRSGSAFARQARWPAEQVTIEGQSKSWVTSSPTAATGSPSTSALSADRTVHYRDRGQVRRAGRHSLRRVRRSLFPDARASPSGKSASMTGSRFSATTSSIRTS